MTKTNWIVNVLGVAIFVFLVAPLMANTVTLPPVKVTAPTLGGGVMNCYGSACGDAVQEEAAAALALYQLMYDTYPDEDLPLDKKAVCSRLSGNIPSGCGRWSPPPSVPGFDPAWAANGCGTGGYANLLQHAGLTVATPDYSGDLDAPYPGVSFFSACNGHDRCWGSAGNRSVCDLAFRDNLVTACGSVAGTSGYNICLGFAGLYHGAVSTTTPSNNAYANSVAQFNCAAWNYDMNNNGCSR